MTLKKTKKALVFIVAALFLLAGCATAKKREKTEAELNPLPGDKQQWTAQVDKNQKSLVKPPQEIPCITGIMLDQAEKEFDKELMVGRVLAWSTDLGMASGYLEMNIEKGAAKILKPRLLALIRMQVSYYVPCAFAIDVNSHKYKDHHITAEEIHALQGKKGLDTVNSFSKRELAALKYTIALSRTPVRFGGQLLGDMRRLFSPKEVVAIGALAAKVNYWARLIEAWRIKPAGYTDDPVLDIKKYDTFYRPDKPK